MNYAVIMAGGKGTRFWPASRGTMPKQFLKICSSRPMIEDCIERVKSLADRKNIMVITNKSQVKALNDLGLSITQNNVIAEPVGRNTAPCIGLAAVYARKRSKGKDATLIALPADHVISQNKRYSILLKKAVSVAKKDDCIVTLGIKPAYPETGYGYIELCKKVSNRGVHVHNVKRFVEKPSLNKARQYVKTQRFCWNAGIFVFRYSVMLDAIEKQMPQLYKGLCTIERAIGTSREKSTIARVYGSLKSESIDYGIMEKYPNVKLLVADVGWNDLGSWRVLADISKKDKLGNASKGHAMFIDASNNYVATDKQLVSVLGVDDLVVVATKDAILVTKKDKSQDVKKITELLAKKKLNQYL